MGNCGGWRGGNFWTIVGLNNFCGINRARVPIFHFLSRLQIMEINGGKKGSSCKLAEAVTCVCVCFFQSLGGSSILLNSPIRFLESVCIMHFQTNVTTKRSYQAALGSSVIIQFSHIIRPSLRAPSLVWRRTTFVISRSLFAYALRCTNAAEYHTLPASSS